MLLIAERLASRVHANIDDTQIDPQDIFGFDRRIFGHIARRIQEELAITVHEVNLTINAISPASEVSTNGNLVSCPSFQRGQADLREVGAKSFERQDTSIVGDAAVFLELGLDRLITLVGFAGLADRPDDELSRETVFLSDVVVDDLLDEELARRLLLEAGGSDIIASGVEGFHRIDEPFLAASFCFQVDLGDGLHVSIIVQVY
jgi:hypothetical protein